jgi:hypothetical protein
MISNVPFQHDLKIIKVFLWLSLTGIILNPIFCVLTIEALWARILFGIIVGFVNVYSSIAVYSLYEKFRLDSEYETMA